MTIHLETKRFLLREFEATDLQGVFELDSDPEVHRYLGNKPIKTLEEAEGMLEYIRDQYKNEGIGRWAVIDKATEEFVGWSGLKYERVVRPDAPYYDIGYRLKRKFWGQGIATETALAAINYGFQKMELAEIFGGAHVDNLASNHVLKKIGLRHLETFEFDGEPHHWYGLTREQFNAS
ncbi:MAG: GNAT family N-acetyltransferase [Bacteroidota bacterium]